MPNLKRYNVIKDGIKIMDSKTVDEIKSVIDMLFYKLTFKEQFHG